MKNTYTVNFVRNDQVCDPIEEHTASNKLGAIKSARKEAKSWRGHVDFKGGSFQVWSQTQDEGFLIFEAFVK